MNKKELIVSVAEATNSTQKLSKQYVDATLEAIISQLSLSNNVDLADFGSFKIKEVAAKTGTVPGTTKTYTSPARKAVKFVPSKRLKDAAK